MNVILFLFFGNLGSFAFDPNKCPHIPIPNFEKNVEVKAQMPIKD